MMKRDEFLKDHAASFLEQCAAYEEWTEEDGNEASNADQIVVLLREACEWLKEIAVQLAYRNERL